MGVGMLRRYHTQAPEHVNEPGDVEASKEAQRVDEIPPHDPPPPSDPDGPAPDDPPPSEPPAGNASQEVWAEWVIASRPDLDEAEVRAMKRDELREQYGPRPE
ncbi:hypothetical protein [Micromonospora sp. NPDC023633]|uniref:hypothetical protein n=1 Tax=Micromonospora sp. NPDC023633 TaxID=3154320 RepID=UPI003403F362